MKKALGNACTKEVMEKLTIGLPESVGTWHFWRVDSHHKRQIFSVPKITLFLYLLIIPCVFLLVKLGKCNRLCS